MQKTSMKGYRVANRLSPKTREQGWRHHDIQSKGITGPTEPDTGPLLACLPELSHDTTQAAGVAAATATNFP